MDRMKVIVGVTRDLLLLGETSLLVILTTVRKQVEDATVGDVLQALHTVRM